MFPMKIFDKPVILLADRGVAIGETTLRKLAAYAHVRSASSAQTLAGQVVDAEIIIFSASSQIDRTVFEAGNRLKAVIKYGTGVDNVDFAAAKRHNVMVVNCPDYGSVTVAEHAFCLMITLAKRLIPITRDMASDGWLDTLPRYQGSDLLGKTLGLFGFGRIGKAMAQLATGFGMRRLACNSGTEVSAIVESGVEPVDRDTLIAESDFLSLHCVHTPATRHMVNADFLSRMKQGAYLINVSRGQLIVDEDLIHALNEGWLAGAGLDVYNTEPLPTDHPFRDRDDIILTPHTAWYTRDAKERIDQEALLRVKEVIVGDPPKNRRRSLTD